MKYPHRAIAPTPITTAIPAPINIPRDGNKPPFSLAASEIYKCAS